MIFCMYKCITLYIYIYILCIEIFRQSNTGFEEYNNFVLKWDGMLPILKDWSDERLDVVYHTEPGNTVHVYAYNY